MFVTSDVFDLERIARRRGIRRWREWLIGGIAVHGVDYPGSAALASFYIEAAELCGLTAEMEWASYTPAWRERQRYIKPSSMVRLAQGGLRGAHNAIGVLLRGSRAAAGTDNDWIIFGGEGSSPPRERPTADGPRPVENYPYRDFDADFLFPIARGARDTANNLLSLSVELLGANYGYFFIRDQLCYPSNYTAGMGTSLDYSKLQQEDGFEVWKWREYVREGRLWTEGWPQLRDLFAVNLLSDRHFSLPAGQLGSLRGWINSARGRGQLKELGQGRALWNLTDAELYAVRPVLHEAGLLRSCRPRYYRHLPVAQERPDPGLPPHRLYSPSDFFD